MTTVIITVELLLAVAIAAAIGKRLPIPLPILYVAVGLGLSFVPQLGAVTLDPAIFFLLFIPPLLFADGWLIPKREFYTLVRPILLLAFGLVAITVVDANQILVMDQGKIVERGTHREILSRAGNYA
jgi:monovalent cation/hydrogen antiporter